MRHFSTMLQPCLKYYLFQDHLCLDCDQWSKLHYYPNTFCLQYMVFICRLYQEFLVGASSKGNAESQVVNIENSAWDRGAHDQGHS